MAAVATAACSPTEPAPPLDRAVTGEPTLTTGRDVSSPSSPPQVHASASLRPRRGIAGIAGFQSSSRVVYASKPDEPHQLSTIYLFPDRMRMRLSLERGKTVERVLLYRFGVLGFCIDERESSSRELAGGELSDLRLQSEARRALFLWPDGLEWRGEGGARTAAIEGVGRLDVELGTDGRPVALRSTDVAGLPVESLRAITWKKIGERHFPARFELCSRSGEPICAEEVQEVETKLDYVDDFFLPPDRRAGGVPRPPPSRASAPEAVDLPTVWELRVPLDAASQATLESALAAAEAQRALWKSRGADLQDEQILELDREARPLSVLIHAQSDDAPAGGSWVRRGESPAWKVSLERAQDAGESQIAALAARCELEVSRVQAELHVASSGAAKRVTLVVLRR